MTPILQVLEARIARTLAEVAGVPDAPAAVRPSQDERFGDFQANGAMPLAKARGMKSRDLAQAAAAKLDLGDLCAAVEVAGPGFINLRLSAAFVGGALAVMNADPRLGIDAVPRPETVVVDFSCPNVAKEMHIGHIRSTLIGDAVSRLLEARGYDVRRINHIGDWGTQFGMLIQFLRRTEPGVVAGRTVLAIEDLEAFYRRAKECFDRDAGFADAARLEVVKLQGGDAESRRVWAAICEASRRKFEENYRRLDVRLDEMGESFYNPMLPEVVADLAARSVAVESDGALCVFCDGFAAPFMIRKRDGGYGYATTDIAALRYRVRELGAACIVYVTDARQKDHFAQLFATARRAGYAPPDVRLEHAAFGSILGRDGTPLKTREGRHVLLKDVIEEAVARARAVVTAKNPDLTGAQCEAIAGIVGIGALKYADLRQNPVSDYVFDWDRMLALEGDTAPYLQYAYARIRSIFRKGNIAAAALAGAAPAPAVREEMRLGIWLLRYNEIVEQAAHELRPHLVANYVYELAVRFTSFYSACPVLKAPEPDRTSRLVLCDVASKVIAHGLGLLGIGVSERM